MDSYEVKEVKAIGPMTLQVRFADGVCGEVRLEESHLKGVFAALRDPAIFKKVHCKNGFVEWPGEIDLAPDAMYEEIKANGAWVLN